MDGTLRALMEGRFWWNIFLELIVSEDIWVYIFDEESELCLVEFGFQVCYIINTSFCKPKATSLDFQKGKDNS